MVASSLPGFGAAQGGSSLSRRLGITRHFRIREGLRLQGWGTLLPSGQELMGVKKGALTAWLLQ
jgi:hypothetical protein